MVRNSLRIAGVCVLWMAENQLFSTSSTKNTCDSSDAPTTVNERNGLVTSTTRWARWFQAECLGKALKANAKWCRRIRAPALIPNLAERPAHRSWNSRLSFLKTYATLFMGACQRPDWRCPIEVN